VWIYNVALGFEDEERRRDTRMGGERWRRGFVAYHTRLH
jgi:hypothetical protein